MDFGYAAELTALLYAVCEATGGAMKHEHILSNLPNRWYTHIALRWLRRRMRASRSRYTIEIRYRTAKRGVTPRKGPWGLRRNEALRLAIYLRSRRERHVPRVSGEASGEASEASSRDISKIWIRSEQDPKEDH